MFRFICIVIFLVTFLILSIPIFFVEWVIGKFNREKRDYSSLRLVQWAFKVILKMTSVRTTVIGEENVPDEPVLFIGNHRSFFDILLTYSRCKRLTGYVAKKEMEHIPLLSTWMRYLYCLFLDRENPKEGLKLSLIHIWLIRHKLYARTPFLLFHNLLQNVLLKIQSCSLRLDFRRFRLRIRALCRPCDTGRSVI